MLHLEQKNVPDGAIVFCAGRVRMARKMKLIEIINDTPIPVAYKIAFLTNFYREPLLRRMEQ